MMNGRRLRLEDVAPYGFDWLCYKYVAPTALRIFARCFYKYNAPTELGDSAMSAVSHLHRI